MKQVFNQEFEQVNSMSGLASNFLKSFVLFVAACSILLFSNLDKRISHKNKSLLNQPSDLKRIAFVSFINASTLERIEKGIQDGLAQTGYQKDTDYTLDLYNAQGDIATLNNIVNTLGNADHDLIFTACTPTIQAVSQKIRKTPLVFTAVVDGIAAGLGETEKTHLPNVTGITDLAPHKEMMALIRKMMPKAQTLGTLYNPAEVNSVFAKENMEKAARKEGFALISVPVNTQSEVPDAAAVLCSKSLDAVCQVLDNLSASSYSSIIQAADKANLPYFGFDLPQVKDGASLVLSKDFYETGKQAAGIALEVINGKSPENIPFTSGKRIQADFHEEAIERYGLHIPEYIREIRQANTLRKPVQQVKIAFIGFSNSSPVEDTEKGVRDVIEELGWTEMVDVDVYNAQSDMPVVSNIVDNIIAKSYDLIISACTPTSQAVAHKIKDRPVVFCTVADPVYAGLGKSCEDHPSNITGISVLADFSGAISTIKEIIPDCKAIGSLFNPAEANSVASKMHLEKAAKTAGIELVAIPISTAGEISDATLALLAKDIDAICQITDNLTATSYSGILKEVNQSSIPYFTFMSKQVEDGAFMAFARNYYQNGKDAMHLAARIINGESPGQIPFKLVEKTEVWMNGTARKRLGIVLPVKVSQQIDKTIE